MVDDPSVEDQGGFEFASGMDIFSEPGVMKASSLETLAARSVAETKSRYPQPNGNDA